MTQQGQNRLTKRNLWAFSTGTVGRDAANTLFASYLITFTLFTRSLTTVQFAALNVTIVIVRILDGFINPLLGAAIDATRTRWGKFKPWIFAGMLGGAVVVMLAFANDLQGWGYIVFIGALYLVYSVVYTVNDIAYWGMIPSLARGAEDRNILTSRTTLLAGVGGMLVFAAVPVLTAGDLVIGGNAVTAYRVIALAVAVLFVVFQAITLLGVKEMPLPPKKPAEKFSFRRILHVILHNDQLLWSALVMAFQFLVVGLTALQSTYVYFSFGYNGSLVMVFTVVGSLVQAVIMLFFSPLSRRFTRQQMMNGALISSTVGYTGMLLTGLFFPGSQTVRFMLMAFFLMLANVGPQVISLVGMLGISNSIEYGELKSGVRNEGIATSVRAFASKVSLAIAQFLVSMIYLALRVTQYTNQISVLENQASRGVIAEAVKVARINETIAAIPAASTIRCQLQIVKLL